MGGRYVPGRHFHLLPGTSQPPGSFPANGHWVAGHQFTLHDRPVSPFRFNRAAEVGEHAWAGLVAAHACPDQVVPCSVGHVQVSSLNGL